MHGIGVIVKFLNQISPFFKPGDTIVEIGSTRDTGSTGIFARICRQYGLKFITVDPSSRSYQDAIFVLRKYRQEYQSGQFQAINMKGEEYFKTQAFKSQNHRIVLAYLDGFDIVTDHPHKQSTIDVYAQYGIDLIKDGNRISAEVHLETTKDIVPYLKPNGFICFDDTWYEQLTSTHHNIDDWFGKGATSIPWLTTQGFLVVTSPSTTQEDYPKYNHGVLLQRYNLSGRFE